MTTEIVFETHAISTDNEAGIATGWLEGQLSEEGRRLARRLSAGQASGLTPFTPPISAARSRRPELAFGDSGIPIRRDARLRECNYGSLNGGPVSEVDRDRIKRIDEPFSGGESYQQTVERMRSFLGDVALEHGSGRIVVIGHSATRWALDHLLERRAARVLVGAPFEWQEGWLYELTGDAESTASRSVET